MGLAQFGPLNLCYEHHSAVLINIYCLFDNRSDDKNDGSRQQAKLCSTSEVSEVQLWAYNNRTEHLGRVGYSVLLLYARSSNAMGSVVMGKCHMKYDLLNTAHGILWGLGASARGRV